MKYQKQPLSIAEQIAKLEGRGLQFDDKDLAAKYLSNISYYRLRAYTYPFQDNDDPCMDHQFIREDIGEDNNVTTPTLASYKPMPAEWYYARHSNQWIVPTG